MVIRKVDYLLKEGKLPVVIRIKSIDQHVGVCFRDNFVIVSEKLDQV